MKKQLKLFYIVLLLFVCMIPLLFIGIAGMEDSTENKEKTKFPQVKTEGKWNKDYLSDMGNWFEENFAFRQELVSINAKMMADVFQVSATDKITTGSDGWLYYSATLDDYKGTNQMSDRGVFNVARIVALMQQQTEAKGSQFVFTVPPNKNTLYGENMPYYEKKVDESTNLKRLTEELKKQKVHYVDLYDLFQKQDEVLYLKRDSHWNHKGAVLAYNAILDELHWPHNTYQATNPSTKKNYVGDLAKMLYPETAQAEDNQYYPQIVSYDYLENGKTVEDSEVSTVGYEGTGSLLMYRDSFGNTLLPFMAGEFGTAYFSKLIPYYLDAEIEKTKADVVVVERVERHLKQLALQPPVMAAPEVKVKETEKKKDSDTTFQVAAMGTDQYMAMGTVDEQVIDEDSLIYVKVTGANHKSRTYEAFPVTLESKKMTTDYGYQIYFDAQDVPKGKIETEILIKNDTSVVSVKTDQREWKK